MKKAMKKIIFTGVFLGSVLNFSAENQATAAVLEIKFENFFFSPNEVLVSPGDLVRFVNEDMHSRKIVSEYFDIPRLAPSAYEEVYVKTAGNYKYNLENYPLVTGQFTVKESEDEFIYPEEKSENKAEESIENSKESIAKNNLKTENLINNSQISNEFEIVEENKPLLPATGSGLHFLYFLIFIVTSLSFIRLYKYLKTK